MLTPKDPPKHVLHLVWSCLDIYLAIKTTLKVSLNSYLGPKKWGPSVRILTYQWPVIKEIDLFLKFDQASVKLVSAVKDTIFKKNGGQFFFSRKKTKPWASSEPFPNNMLRRYSSATQVANLGQCFVALDPSAFTDNFPQRLQVFCLEIFIHSSTLKH